METPVLYDVNLVIHKGEFVSIMGPSGSGKSTLMHILGFLDTPTKGTFLLQGKSAGTMDDDALAAVRATRVSFVFQAFNLLPRTTVLQNVMLPLLYHPTIPDAERLARSQKAIDLVGLTERAQYLTNQLSGGQQQRVAIARALVTSPDIIFADEPTGNLDSASGGLVMATLQKLHKEGHTIILVTHERRTAEHAERIIHILDGKIQSDSKDFKRILAGTSSLLK
jgi:putative ABC transport system ATP-binding protein